MGVEKKKRLIDRVIFSEKKAENKSPGIKRVRPKRVSREEGPTQQEWAPSVTWVAGELSRRLRAYVAFPPGITRVRRLSRLSESEPFGGRCIARSLKNNAVTATEGKKKFNIKKWRRHVSS